MLFKKEKKLNYHMSVDDPKSFQVFVSRHSIVCLVKYCIQIIYTNK